MDNPRILILTDADDVHAIAVVEALRLRGVEATLWATSDFPTRSEETFHYDEEFRSAFRVEGVDFSLHDSCFDVVWRRRPAFVIEPELIHPSDRVFVETECGIFRRSLLHLLAPGAFWVNPIDGAAKAGSKMIQHQAAAKVGLQMPETLYTNSPGEVRAFIRRKRGGIIYKPFLSTGWSDGTHQFLSYTALLTDESLIQESLRFTPGIFQELVPKAYEVRLTMMGNRAFAAKLFSQETSTGRLDWRQAQGELRFEPITMPDLIVERCRALLQELGLVFGCFDFVVTPDGKWVFLEVNEMGQFLFVERYSYLPLLDAFASFLLQGTADFEWCESEVTVRYSDPGFEKLVTEKSAAFAGSHVSIPARLVGEPSA
jgi:glutathione synthase/RimK-type ligase-like ATP-grasp enzyme